MTIDRHRDGAFKVLEDGSLLFERLPQEKIGYTQDPFNKKRLIPTHPPCKMRITQPRLLRTGLHVITNECNCPGHPVRGQEVTPEDCKACTLRITNTPIDGTLEM